MAPDTWPTLQKMVPHLGICGQHRMDSIGYLKKEEKDKKFERARRSGVIWEEAGREMGRIMTKLYASLKFSKN